MPYRFRRTESVQNGLKRIASEQVQRAIGELQKPEDGLHEAVHQVRKRFKKIRGLMRLVRPGFPQYDGENAWYRDAGREMSRVRDAESMRKAAVDLVPQDSSPELADALAGLEAALRERERRITTEAAGLEGQLAQLAADLQQALGRIDSWRLKGKPRTALLGGLKKTWGRGCEALGTLESADQKENADSEAWHEWRKRVKYHWYHTRLLVSVWKPVMQARKQEFSRLSDLLGDEHDLSVLRELLNSEDGLAGSPEQEGLIRQQIATRQQKLRRDALSLGRRAYAEQPAALRHRMKQCWTVWRKGL